MKKFIVNLIIGLILIIVLDYGVGKSFEYFYFKQTSGSLYKTTYAMDSCEEEVLVFGSSRASHHYRPDIFEKELKLSFYNTGKDGNYIFYQTALLKSVLKRYSPKLIVYDFYGSLCYEQSDYDRLSILLPYYKEHSEIRATVNMRSKFEHLKNWSGIYPYNSSIAKIALGLTPTESDSDENQGYEPLYGEFKNLPQIEFREPCETDSNKVKSFQEFLHLCKSNNVPLVVIFSPVSYDNSGDFMLEIAEQICKEEDIPFYDFSKEINFKKSIDYFSDEIHLNDQGSLIFSEKVTTIINKNILE